MIEWLTSLQGILIVSGVILLLITTIIFIVSNKKSKNILDEDLIGDIEEEKPIDDVVKIDIQEPKVEEVKLDVVEPTIEESKVEDITSDTSDFVEPVVVDVPPVISIDSLEEEKVEVPLQEEKKVTIYGGNDPLEATQSMPKMEANHTPYGVSKDEIVFDFPKAADVEKEEL